MNFWWTILGMTLLVAILITGFCLAGLTTGASYTSGVVLIGVGFGLMLVWLIVFLFWGNSSKSNVVLVEEDIRYSKRDIAEAYERGRMTQANHDAEVGLQAMRHKKSYEHDRTTRSDRDVEKELQELRHSSRTA